MINLLFNKVLFLKMTNELATIIYKVITIYLPGIESNQMALIEKVLSRVERDKIVEVERLSKSFRLGYQGSGDYFLCSFNFDSKKYEKICGSGKRDGSGV